MQRICLTALLLLSGFLLGGCASGGFGLELGIPVETLGQSRVTSYAASGYNNNPSPVVDDEFVYQRLISQYHEWRGVPYQLGGSSKRGVDCSGFVQQAFRMGLGVSVPRSTQGLSQAGKAVDRRSLRAGDLVFFDTGVKQAHVGIYLDDGQFLHASTSQGVTISSLSNIYWRKNFRKAVRLPI